MAVRRVTKQQKMRRPFWEEVALRCIAILKKMVIPALLIWLVTWMSLGGVFANMRAWAWNGFVGWTATQGLVVDDIVIKGRHRVDAMALKQAIDVKQGDALLSVDVESIQDKISNFDWVETVSVGRSYNGVITVKMKEKIPFVLWQRPGRPVALLDTNGDIINGADNRQFTDLLVISGVDAPQYAIDLMQLLMAEPDVRPYIQMAQWVGDRRWDIITTNAVRVLLPEDDSGYALSRLAKLQKDKQILDKSLKQIDLRSPDRIIIETKRGDRQNVTSLSLQPDTNSI